MNALHFNVFLGSKMLATYAGSGYVQANWHYSLNDWLGTRRVQANAEGVAEGSFQSMPFGDGLTMTGAAGATENEFTGKERDSESGSDYFGARYYSSNMGRFLSPDWSAKLEPVPYSKLDNPQSLNLYTYVLNNPLSSVDPDGHQDCSGTHNSVGKNCVTEDGAKSAAEAQQQNAQAQTTTPNSSDPIVNAVQTATGATATPSADPNQQPFAKGGHLNETDTLTFKSPEAKAKFLAESGRKSLVPGDVSENGFGPGVRLPGGLHMETGHLDAQGNLVVTSHIDRFNPNNGLGPMVGHAVVDVFIGTVFFRHSAGLD